jgi:hypothetical protein
MQVIERYEQSCPKDSMNVNGRCYLKNEVSPICGKDSEPDNKTGVCITTHPANTRNFVDMKDGKCPIDYTKVYVNNSKDVKCSVSKYITPLKCETNFQEIDKGMCWNGKTKSTPVGCSPGDKLVANECIAAPIPNVSCASGSKLVGNECITINEPISSFSCPPNPFTGDKLTYDPNKKLCK